MEIIHRSLLPGLLILAIGAGTAVAETAYLEANFDGEPIDVPIGIAGPSIGQPIRVDPGIEALVREGTLPTPSLEITDIDDNYGGYVWFEFLGGHHCLDR